MTSKLRDISEQPDLQIGLSDGVKLSCRIWLPDDAAQKPVPAILEYLPYRKRDGTCARDSLTHPWFAKRGYACLRVDIRGNGDSEGLMADEYSPRELSDAVEVINWIANQPWSNGRVGMMGISWGGFNGLQVAALAPQPLKAVVTLCSTVDRFADDIHFKGGCLLNENLGWGATMWSYSSRAPDPALRANWRDMWLQRLEAEPFLPAVWLRHQQRDAYWRHGSVCEDYDAIKARVLAVGGWGDAYKNAVPQLVRNLPGAKGIVGPWVHKYPHFAVPEPRIGFLQVALRWWDRWLKGDENGAEHDPAYRVYKMDGVRPATWYAERSGRWISALPAPAQHRRLHLSADGLGARGDFVRPINSPQDTGADGGEYCAIWLGPELPGDQRGDDALSACWDSTPLETDLEIVGAPEVMLTLATDQAQANIAVRLCHVHPDGASTRITYGVLNLSHREGSAAPKPMPVGKPVEVRMKLDHIAYQVPKGHRLRLAVSSAYWPLIWPSPAHVSLTATGGYVDLPLCPEDASECSFPPPDSETPWKVNTLRPETHKRNTVRNHVTGVVTLEIEDDFGHLRDLDHGLETSSIAREWWSIHPDNPLSAHGKCHWSDEMIRGEITLRTEARCEMWSDSDNFYLRYDLQAYENDTEIFNRAEEKSIPRGHL